jgi:DNA-binding transcriptional LysR family regulator
MGELESIRVFLAVTEQRGFAGAARALGMTPASVTRSVAALEEKLGVQLFKRTTRQVSLTSAGAVYAARVAQPVAALADAAEATRESQGMTSGLIRVSAPMSLGLKVLPSVLSQFAAIHPQTKVALTLSDSFIDIVEDDYDLAIRISGPPSDKSTIWRKISRIPRLLVAAPGYLTARGTPEAPDDLGAHACLSYSDGPAPEEWKLSRGQRHRTHAATGAFCANNGDILARLAVNGEGIALLPRFIVADDLRAGRLVPVLPEWEVPEIWLTLYYPPYDRLPLRVATFSDFFEHHVRQVFPPG